MKTPTTVCRDHLQEDRAAINVTCSVVLVSTLFKRPWHPTGRNTSIPCENSRLPLRTALKVAECLNQAYREMGRNRIAVVFRRPHGAGPRYSVASLEGMADSASRGAPTLRNVKAMGLPVLEALAEVERINTDILQYAHSPKVWAVAIVEEVGEGVSA